MQQDTNREGRYVMMRSETPQPMLDRHGVPRYLALWHESIWCGIGWACMRVACWLGNAMAMEMNCLQEDEIGVDGSNIMDMSRVDGWCIEYSISLGPACEAVKSDL